MAPVKKMVMKVNMSCPKCKSEVLKAVTSLSGVDQVTVDGEKGILTVIGEVDPVLVSKKIKKTGKNVKIESVGPPKKPDSPNKTTTIHNSCLPPYCGCRQPQLVAIGFPSSYDNGFCSIL